MTRKIACVVGARPNFMKIAPILRAFPAHGLEGLLVHTGQHYDYAMNATFFDQLRIPAPDISLEVGSGSHAWQTAEIMVRFEKVLEEERPDCVLVVGDVNSTIACALVAAKKGVPVVHVEAGLRSRDRQMPEEINRILTDQLSDRLYVTERSAIGNLEAEGIASERIVFTGNVMIDALLQSLDDAVPAWKTIASELSPEVLAAKKVSKDERYSLLTLHRPSNVDDPAQLTGLLEVLAELSHQVPMVFPVHPRTASKIRSAGLDGLLEQSRILPIPPVGYLEMLGLSSGAVAVLTDSGGLQEETTALGVPCLTLRENTERPITIAEGTNTLVGTDPAAIRNAWQAALSAGKTERRKPEYWDGHAAERIAHDLSDWLH